MLSSGRLCRLLLSLQYLPFAMSSASTPSSPLTHKTILSYSHISSSDPSTPQHLATISYDPLTSQTSLDSWTPPSIPSVPYDPTTQNLPLVKILTETGSSTLTSLAVFNSSTSTSPEAPPSFDHDIIINLSISSPDAATDPVIYAASITSTAPLAQKDAAAAAAGGISKFTKSGKPKSAARLAREAREAERDAKLAEKARIRSAKKSASKSPPGATPSAAAVSSSSKATGAAADSKYPHVHIHLQAPVAGPTPQLAPARKPRVGADGKTPLSAEQAAAVEDEEANKVEKSFFQKYWWVFLVMTVLAMGGSGEK